METGYYVHPSSYVDVPCEIGAGWRRRSENGTEYTSVKLDDPSFAEPIWCALFKSEGGMYVLDLVPAGICGLMPGLGMADLLQQVWRLATGGQSDEERRPSRLTFGQPADGDRGPRGEGRGKERGQRAAQRSSTTSAPLSQRTARICGQGSARCAITGATADAPVKGSLT